MRRPRERIAAACESPTLTLTRGKLALTPVPSSRGGHRSNWLEPTGGWNTWAIDVDHFAVGTGDHRVSTKGMTAAVDPAYNVIAAPYAVVREVYARVPGAAQDPVYPARWVKSPGCAQKCASLTRDLAQNLACDASLHLSLVIDGLIYKIADQGLVQHRNSKTCWGGLVAWGNGTRPDEEGRIVLGVPFMQGVYR